MSLRNRNKSNKDLKQDLKDAPGASVDPSFSKASSEMAIMKGRQWRRETGKNSCGVPNYTRKSYDNKSYGVMNANLWIKLSSTCMEEVREEVQQWVPTVMCKTKKKTIPKDYLMKVQEIISKRVQAVFKIY